MRPRRAQKTASARLNIRKFKTTMQLSPVTTDAAGNFKGSFASIITDIDNTPGNNYGGIGMQSALRSLYEEYKFDAIKYTFVPNYTQAAAGVGLGSTGSVTYAVNRAPASQPPTSFVDILRQNDCKVQLATKGFSVTVRKPHWCAITPLNNDVQVGAANPAKILNVTQATSSAFVSTRDYPLPSGGFGQPEWAGMDLAIQGAPVSATVYRVYATLYLTFRNQN